MGIFTDLSLHGDTPLRVQPETGEWGPVGVQPTRRKRHARWLWPVVFVVIAVALFWFGYWVYGLIMGQGS